MNNLDIYTNINTGLIMYMNRINQQAVNLLYTHRQVLFYCGITLH